MIVIRFGRWPRQLHDKYEDTRIYLRGWPVPFCRRQLRAKQTFDPTHDIGIMRTAGMRVDSACEKRKRKRNA